jgi:membrane-associated phospholipid phosphatase
MGTEHVTTSWQLSMLRGIQAFHTPLLDHLMIGLSWLGTEGMYTLVLPILFWSLNRRLGLRVGYVLLVSMFANAWLKAALLAPRPIGIPGVRSLYTASATGASMPSGHAQGSLTFWWLISRWLNRRWLWCGSLVLVFLIGLSRLYLGLHWPLDVLVGWLLGLAFGIGGWWVSERWKRVNGLAVRLGLAMVLPGALIIVHNDTTSLQYASLLLGAGVGAVLEGQWLTSDIERVWWKRVCAAVIGIAGIIALQWMIKWPDGTWAEAERSVCLGLWATLGAPYLFVWLGLYRRKGSAGPV